MTLVLCRHRHFGDWDTRRSFIVNSQVLNLHSVIGGYICGALCSSRCFKTEQAVIDRVFGFGTLFWSVVVGRVSTWSLLAFTR